MNEVYINLKSGDSISIVDDENLDHEQLAHKLSSLFSVTNVAILKGLNSSIVIRPSDISTIEVKTLIEEQDQIEQSEEIVEPPPKKEEVKESEEIVEDIITDMD